MQPSSLRNSTTPPDSPAPQENAGTGNDAAAPTVFTIDEDGFTRLDGQKNRPVELWYKFRNDGSKLVGLKFLTPSTNGEQTNRVKYEWTLSEPQGTHVGDWLQSFDNSEVFSDPDDRYPMRRELWGLWSKYNPKRR
ncbi:hypothetical protein I302_102652 [Kwoniella bestiolae CBS 10118]|uniref:Uncharacterized protein n=1 Tax=Kwoniella bestiolae CBS 10118 TaxID=1296100 RepID=A0A1B9GFU8_9TREE|nr:hypothetical protein I302_01344 [Kwoniella bestiolae CBS 10118]OCF29831.1 hypothetical protein I302_01344 [Kwoniella bestiolae CBS 10118]